MTRDDYTGNFNQHYYYNNLCVAGAVAAVLDLPFSYYSSNPFRYTTILHPGPCVFTTVGNNSDPCDDFVGTYRVLLKYRIRFTVGEPDTPYKGNPSSVIILVEYTLGY